MGAAVAAVIVIVTAAAIALTVFVATRYLSTQRSALLPPSPGSGPEYKHRPETVKYYGQPAPSPPGKPMTPEKPTSNDPRHVPLPRCPGCGAATAYGDDKCRKCGLDLKKA